ncbi:MAG TPA: archaellin/type IV pilin N-terminal domain-containing protein [Candidatus Bathyarchaeia archaeon]
MRERKAISPVIATVILVAVAITVAVGVSYWMSGISSQYTQFENIEIRSWECTSVAFGNWAVVLTLKNSGTATATITGIYVNENEATPDSAAPVAAVDTITTDLTTVTAWSLTPGDNNDLTVWIGLDYGTLSSGTTVNLRAHSAGGMDYIKLVKLP